MKVGVVHTSSNNAEKLLEIAAEWYPGVKVINITDEALWEMVLAADGVMTERCCEILAEDFKRLEEAGCVSAGLLCSLVKDGIDTVRKSVSIPVAVYDDAAVEKAVRVSGDGDTIAVIAMRNLPLPIAAAACEKEIARSGKKLFVKQIMVEEAAECLKETGDEKLADDLFVKYLQENQHQYSAYVIPQVPLSRLMPRLRSMETPVFDSMKTLLDVLAESADISHSAN